MNVQIKYEIGKGREHLATVTYKGMILEAGKTYEVSPVYAGMAAAGLDGVTVVSGEPTPWVRRTGAERAELRRARERAEAFPSDPAKVLDGQPAIPDAVAKKLRSLKEADAVKVLEEGLADACLGVVAVWAQLGGLVDLAKAAVRRAEALRLKG